ncbi:MAG TPA: cell division protein FtsZ [Patescibacteria group bacterium]|nr:cell division protein FtsZ [Patescibacteria group bacterium]
MINIRMQQTDVKKLQPKITVVGVGGAGGNAVNNMIGSGLQGADFVVCNTDAQALESSLCETRLQLGVAVTSGLGAGAKPEIGKAAAEESLDDVMQYLEGSNMAFITAGMGGGTGTGAAPVIARACREKGILTVGVVTKPFHFEGALRMKMAEAGIEEMQGFVDTLIVIPNQNLFRIANEKTTFADAFKLADSVLQSGVRGVTDLMIMPGLINLDFADIRSVMQEMGKAMMGTGEATGDKRAIHAAEAAISNPLLDDVSMKGARGVIVNVTGGLDMTLFEVDEACNRIGQEVDPNANIIFGSTFDESLEGKMRVSVVATGIDVVEEKGRKRTGGGLSVNAVSTQTSQPERRFERVQSYQSEPVAVAAQVHQVEKALPHVARHATGLPPSASYTPSPYAEATARRIEAEKFQQQEFAIEAEKKPEPTPYAAAAAEVRGGGPRGTIVENYFIPPKPVEVEPPRDSYGPAGLGSLAAPRRTEEHPVQTTSSGLNLRPPVPGGGFHGQKPKRTPSLFERFTSPLRGGDEEEVVAEKPAAAPRPHRTVQERQESLGMDLRKNDPVDDELDIPAFLRRQAN